MLVLLVYVFALYAGVVSAVMWVVGVPRDNSAFLLSYQAVLGAATLLALLWCPLRRQRAEDMVPTWRALLGLNVGFVFVAWIFDLLGRAIEVGDRLSAAAAVLVLVGIAWDLAMSGENITNRDGRFSS